MKKRFLCLCVVFVGSIGLSLFGETREELIEQLQASYPSLEVEELLSKRVDDRLPGFGDAEKMELYERFLRFYVQNPRHADNIVESALNRKIRENYL